MKISGRRLRCKLLLLLLTCALSLPGIPQDAPQQDAPATAEHHVTREEAQELFRSVDEILQFASKQTGLPIRRPVKKKLATREEVAKYVAKRLKEQGGTSERFDRTALPLKKLGLLPRDFDLRKYMLDLYKEQVEGWYDSRNKTIYLLDWVAPDEQKPVIAHELVHALQDQNFGLDDWLNVAKDSKDASVQIALEEQRVARQSVVEGQAMAVLMAYVHGVGGSGVQSEPSQSDQTSSGKQGSDDGTPMYAHAPVYLREALLFPYKYGLTFVRYLSEQRGKQSAFAGVFHNPPSDTRQIMQPSTYVSSEPQPQMEVLAVDRVLGPDWRRVGVSGIGQIDLEILLRVWGGDQAAGHLTDSWCGGYYVAVDNKNLKNAPTSLALVIQFRSPEAALQFSTIYISALTTRYRSVRPANVEMMQPAAFTHHILGQWGTEEGLVSLYVDGPTVLALESFNPTDAARLHAALMPAATAAGAGTSSH